MANLPCYRVKFDFSAEEEAEMSVLQGEIVIPSPGEDGVFSTEDDTRDGWILVEKVEDPEQNGYVPTDYLEIVEEKEPVAKTQQPTYNQAPPSPAAPLGFTPPPVVSDQEQISGVATKGSAPGARKPSAQPGPKLLAKTSELDPEEDGLLRPAGVPLAAGEAGAAAAATASSARWEPPLGAPSPASSSKARLHALEISARTSSLGAAREAGGEAAAAAAPTPPAAAALRYAAAAATPTPAKGAAAAAGGAPPSAPPTAAYSYAGGGRGRSPPPRAAAAAATPVRRFDDPRLGATLQAIAGRTPLAPTPAAAAAAAEGRPAAATDPVARLAAQNAAPLTALREKGLLGDAGGRGTTPGSALRAAVRGVQAANALAHQAPAVKPPSLSAAVASGDFSLLLEKNEDFFNELISTRTESFASVLQLQENVGAKLAAAAKASVALSDQILELETLVDQERRSWKYMAHGDTEEELLGKLRGRPGAAAAGRPPETSFLSQQVRRSRNASQRSQRPLEASFTDNNDDQSHISHQDYQQQTLLETPSHYNQQEEEGSIY